MLYYHFHKVPKTSKKVWKKETKGKGEDMAEMKKSVVILHADLDQTRANLMKRVLFQVLKEMDFKIDYGRVQTKEDALNYISEKSPNLLIIGSPFTDEGDVGDDCDAIREELKRKNPNSYLFFQTSERPTIYELGYITITPFLFKPQVDKERVRSCFKYINFNSPGY